MTHEECMRRAIELSRIKAAENEGGPFGAVIARDGVIVGEGWNEVTGHNDPTAHAEIVAIRDACRTLGTFRLDDCVIYSSCEPCPMCLAAIHWAHIGKVFFANTAADAERIGFDDKRLYQELALPPHERTLPCERILAEEALAVFDEWFADPGRVPY